MENNYTVYAHKFPNGKYYIGLTKQNPIRRWNNGNGYKEQPVYKEIQLFGWENIEHIIVKSNLTQEEAQELEQRLIFLTNSMIDGYNNHKGGGIGGNPTDQFEYNGELLTADEIAKLSNVDGITGHDITTRVNHHGWNLERAMNQPKMKKNQRIEYNGNYYTINELYELRKNKSLTHDQIESRILCLHWDVERALTQPNNVKKQPFGITERIYEYNGILYNVYEVWLMRKHPELKEKDISFRLHRGWSVERTISQPPKKQNQKFEYNGKLYTSKELADLSPIPEITHHDITDRINRMGWSVEKAINTPKNYKYQHKRTQANQQPSLGNSSNSTQEGSETNS